MMMMMMMMMRMMMLTMMMLSIEILMTIGMNVIFVTIRCIVHTIMSIAISITCFASLLIVQRTA